MERVFLRLAPRLAALTVVLGVSTSWAQAESELIVRSSLAFDACPAKVDAMLTRLDADERNIRVVRDTGAHYSVKLVARSANLVFLCNAVNETIEITRTTPGELNVAGNQ
jgi:hypothetical protein